MQLLVNNITFHYFARRIHELTGKCCILIGREILALSGDFATKGFPSIKQFTVIG